MSLDDFDGQNIQGDWTLVVYNGANYSSEVDWTLNVKTDNSTASKIIEEVTNIETEKNISLKVIAGISEKDSTKLNELSGNNKEQMDELTIDAVQKAENTSEDSELIANNQTSITSGNRNRNPYIGSRNAEENWRYFDGYLSEIKIWSDILNPQDLLDSDFFDSLIYVGVIDTSRSSRFTVDELMLVDRTEWERYDVEYKSKDKPYVLDTTFTYEKVRVSDDSPMYRINGDCNQFVFICM